MTTSITNQVRRRRVFYIPGYDPIHPRRYRELYRKEGRDQAKISGYQIDLTAKTPNDGPYGWHVQGQIEGAEISADVEVLVWSDIVRASMSTSIVATYLHLIRTAWTYIASGTLRRLMRLRKGPVIAAFYPVGMLILQPVLAFLAAWFVAHWGAFAVRSLAAMMTTPYVAGMAGMAVFILLVLAVFITTMRWFKKHDGRFFAYYLMHDYAWSASLNGANPPALEERMAAFGALIARALQEDLDEVLVVGHSSGAHIGVSVLADLIRGGQVPDDGPALSFLSLGQVVPMVSFLPDAHRLRGDLQYLSARRELTWVDVTAPGDGCAFALCDPVCVSGVAPPDKKWPLVLSAAFTQTLSPERWAELRWRFFRLHFQYMCAFDVPGDYDYFRITAGPQTLGDRYADRAPSGSRIDHSVSKYTSVTP